MTHRHSCVYRLPAHIQDHRHICSCPACSDSAAHTDHYRAWSTRPPLTKRNVKLLNIFTRQTCFSGWTFASITPFCDLLRSLQWTQLCWQSHQIQTWARGGWSCFWRRPVCRSRKNVRGKGCSPSCRPSPPHSRKHRCRVSQAAIRACLITKQTLDHQGMLKHHKFSLSINTDQITVILF